MIVQKKGLKCSKRFQAHLFDNFLDLIDISRSGASLTKMDNFLKSNRKTKNKPYLSQKNAFFLKHSQKDNSANAFKT